VEDNSAPAFDSCPNDIFLAEGQTANWIEPTAEDNCGTVNMAQTMGLPNGSVFPLGVSPVEYTAADENGNDAVCSFNVIVNDEEAAIFDSCPEDATIATQNGICGAVYSWEEPTVKENTAGTTIIQTQGPPSGSVFDLGTTGVEYVSTDLAGNASYCSFIVTVFDNLAPEINECPTDIQIESDENAVEPLLHR
jgi:large repetitive protein